VYKNEIITGEEDRSCLLDSAGCWIHS